MKKFLYALGILSLLTLSSLANAGGFWQDLNSTKLPTTSKERPRPADARLISLNDLALKQILTKAGTDVNHAVTISLPTIDGKELSFKVWNTPVMDAELQKAHPSIQTYSGVLVSDPSVYLKLSHTPMGVFAYVFGKLNIPSFVIEPSTIRPEGYYNVFKANEVFSIPGSEPCKIFTNNLTTIGGEGGTTVTPPKSANRTLGTIRHRYKAAITCTGEYAALVTESASPSLDDVLSIITATMNNVNGYWEQEISATTYLVNNEAALIFTNAATDPYQHNGNNDSLIDEVQPVLDSLIGSHNFDIGHIFNTAGGGLAQLNSLCSYGSQGRGVSGTSGPEDIHVVIHEMGHQVSNGHTFASNTDGCNGNIMSASAWEPGSGNTVMSYDGSCGVNNLSNSVEHYNGGNLMGIADLFASLGSTCGTTYPSVPLTAPIVYPNNTESYTIPAYTPFEIIGTKATRAAGSQAGAIYYNWDQHDTGNLNQTESQNANATEGPIFAVTDLDTIYTKAYPSYEILKTGVYEEVGQRLPKTERDITFVTTLRAYSADGWGTFYVTDSTYKIHTSNTGWFRVTSQSGAGIVWEPYSQQVVTWDTVGTRKTPISCGFVNIYLSKDGGSSFPIILATNVPNTGSYTLTVPNTYTVNGRIKVKAVGNIFFDVTKTDFTINGDPTSVGNLFSDNDIKIYPNPNTDGTLYIDAKNYNGNAYDIYLFNSLGQKVWGGIMSNSLTKVNTRGLSSGIYYVHIQDKKSGKAYSKNIVIQ